MEKFLKNLKIANLIKNANTLAFTGEFMCVISEDFTLYVRDNTPAMGFDPDIAKRIHDAFKHEDTVLSNVKINSDFEVEAYFSNNTILKFPSDSEIPNHDAISKIDDMNSETIALHTIKKCNDFVGIANLLIRGNLNNVIVNDGIIMGSDGHSMYYEYFHNPMISVGIPSKVCDIIIKSGMFDIVSIYYKENVEEFVVTDSTKSIFIFYRTDVSKLDIRKVIPEAKYSFSLPMSYLKMLTKPNFKGSDIVRLEFYDNFMWVKIKKAEGSLLSEHMIKRNPPYISWSMPYEINHNFSARKLQKLLRRADKDMITMEFSSNSHQAMRLCSNYILMPVLSESFDELNS